MNVETAQLLSALRNGDKENFFGSVVAGQPVNQPINLGHIAAAAEPATLEIAVQGVTHAAHVIAVQLNGNDVGELAFQGQVQGVSTFQVLPSLLREPQRGHPDRSRRSLRRQPCRLYSTYLSSLVPR